MRKLYPKKIALAEDSAGKLDKHGRTEVQRQSTATLGGNRRTSTDSTDE